MQAIIDKSPNAIATFQLQAGEAIVAAPNRLLSKSSGVSLRSFFGLEYRPTLRRLPSYWNAFLGFFQAFFHKIFRGVDSFWHIYQANSEGRVVLTPSLPGEITSLSLSGRPLYFQPESFLACSSGVTLDRAPRSTMLCATGEGTLYISGFGEIAPIEVDGSFAVDVERLVALEPSLSFQVHKKTLELFGKGKLWVQTGKPSQVMRLRATW
jgi:uncharacterized protein (AIM24 family)